MNSLEIQRPDPFKQAQDSCNHPVFCNIQILQAAADSGLFQDSKTFVDLALKYPVEEVLANFKKQKTQDFIKENFEQDPNILLTSATFSDYQQNPKILDKISDPQIKNFAKELNSRWNQLGKKLDFSKAQTVGTCKQQCSSYLEDIDKFTMLVPGGRFRQSYYWDTYWIILGLISCDMLDTAQLILSNFGRVIEKYGFIPNGFRQYFLNRSQPPYYFLMVQAVVGALEKKGLLAQANELALSTYQTLVKQHQVMQQTHSISAFIEGESYTLNQYRARTEFPRPQSYKQDVATVSTIIDPNQKKRVLSCISSMAQSGWDFSSRWLKGSKLSSTMIDKIIPSDLNALMGMMEQYLAELSQKYGTKYDVEYYTSRYGQRMSYFNKIKADGRFRDFDLTQSKNPDIIYPTDFFPYIFLKQKHSVSNIYKDVVNPVSSTKQSGQQWDSPNVWAPNNWIIHEISPPEEARKYAEQWVHTTYCSYKKHGFLFEKYLNSKLGERGEGGQYAPQVGFGWTNGLALHYLSLYPDIKTPDCE